MRSVRALARQLRLRRVAYALFARHASDSRWQMAWFGQSRQQGNIERYVVRLYLGAWIAALALGSVAGATRATQLSGLLVGLVTVAGVRFFVVRAGSTWLRIVRWRRGRALDHAMPHVTATLRRCVAGTTDRQRLLTAVARATDEPAAQAVTSLRQRTELEGVEAALRATARTTPSPAFAGLCRALCGPEEKLTARLDGLDMSRAQQRTRRKLMTTLRTGTRSRTRRRQREQCERLLTVIETELRAGATLSHAVERAAMEESLVLAPAVDRLAGGVAVGTPMATQLAFEQLATEVAAPSARRELRRVAAALACDCSPADAIASERPPSAGDVCDGTMATSVGER